MHIFYADDNTLNFNKSAVTIGSFDGVHRGHRLLIDNLNKLAQKIDSTPIVITFDPHPRQVLRGDNKLLSTLGEKLFLLEESGVQNVVIIKFDKQFSETPYNTFITDFLVSRLHATDIFISDGHHFGHNKQGTQEALQNHHLTTHYIPRLEDISSTIVRQAIQNNDMQRACELLGAPYLIKVPVNEPSKLLPAADINNNQYIRIINN